MVYAAIIAASLVTPTHDSWINGLRNSAGEWCCGEKDCEVVTATEVTGGFSVALPRGGIITEFVPYAEAAPSPDGQYWRCHRADGQRLCFFAPPRSF